jgi:hypothetical protein
MALQLLIICPHPRRWGPLVVFGAGTILGVLPPIIYSGVVTGEWTFTHYGHWLGNHPMFSREQPWTTPLSHPEAPSMGKLITRGLLGLNEQLTLATPPVFLVLLAGGFAALLIPDRVRWRDNLQKQTLLVLLLFALSQAAFFLFYRWYAARFFIGAFPALVVFGLVGWERIIRRVCGLTSGKLKSGFVIFVAAAAIFCVVEPISVPYRMARLQEMQASRKRTRDIRDYIDKIRGTRDVVRPLPGPMFVEGFSVLSARVWFDMIGAPRPITVIRTTSTIDNDSHVAQFSWYPVRDPLGHVNDSPVWDRDPTNTWLMNVLDKSLNEEFLRELTAPGQPPFSLCYHIAYHGWAVPVLEWADRNGIPRYQIDAPGVMVVYVVGAENPNPPEH